MKSIKLLCTFVALSLLFSCTQSTNHKTIKLDMVEYESAFDLKNARLIALETNSSCLINRVKKLYVSKHGFFVLNSSPKEVYFFSLEGKYIRTIGAIGRAPNQYLEASYMDVDDQSKSVTIMDGEQGKILTYSFEGDLTNEIQLEDNYIGDIACLGNGTVMVNASLNYMNNSQNPSVALFNPNGDTIQTFFHRPDLNMKRYNIPSSDCYFSRANNQVYFIPIGSDKIYAYESHAPSSLKEVYSLNIDSNQFIPLNEYSTDMYEEEKFKQKIWSLSINAITDNDDFLISANCGGLICSIWGNLSSKYWNSGILNSKQFLPFIITSYKDESVSVIYPDKNSLPYIKEHNIECNEESNPIIQFSKLTTMEK